MKCTRLCKPTFLKAKKLLTLKGLIKYIPGGGRKITNKYTFPLEDGTDEEKRRLLAYLNAKKTGKKSNQINQRDRNKESNEPKDPDTALALRNITNYLDHKTGKKSNQLIEQKQVKNRTTLQPNSEQKTGKKSNREQEVSQKKQQQKVDAVSSSSPSDNQKNRVKDIVKSLLTLGIMKAKTYDLIWQYGLDKVQKQYTWLSLRNITYPAGALIASLKEHWPQPVNFSRRGRPENDSQEYKKQYECLKKASKQRGRLDMERRRKSKTGKKLNPYSPTGPAPYFADQVPDEICKDCPLATDIHPLEHKTQGRLICLRKDVKAGLVGVLLGDTNEETGKKSNQLGENGLRKRRTQPAVP